MAMDPEGARRAFRGIDTECLFCGAELPNQGPAFYDHVEDHPACRFIWEDWMVEIPKDHGGA